MGQATVPDEQAAKAHDRHAHTESRPVEAGRVVADESVGAVVGG